MSAEQGPGAEADPLADELAGIFTRRSPEDAGRLVTEALDRALTRIAEQHGADRPHLTDEDRDELARLLAEDGPARTARVIAASFTPAEQPHAQAITEAFEDALYQASLTRDERIGMAVTDAYRRGEDPAEEYRRWL